MTESNYKKLLNGKVIFYRSCLNLPQNITFGVEIEYENIVKDTVTYLIDDRIIDFNKVSFWENKSEIDIMEEKDTEEMNGEVVSPVLIDKKECWDDLEAVLYLLKTNEAVITEKCGGHVSIGTHVLGENVEYWKRFLLMWILYTEEIYSFSTGEFEKIRNDKDELFASVRDELNVKKILRMRDMDDFYYLDDCLCDKYHDIYVRTMPSNNFEYNNSVEFRIPNGSLNEAIWQNYINFFAKFMLACKKNIDLDLLTHKINNNIHSKIELADCVFDNQLDKNNFLIQAMKTNEIYKKKLKKHIIYY